MIVLRARAAKYENEIDLRTPRSHPKSFITFAAATLRS